MRAEKVLKMHSTEGREKARSKRKICLDFSFFCFNDKVHWYTPCQGGIFLGQTKDILFYILFYI